MDRQSAPRLARAIRRETFHAPIFRVGGKRIDQSSRVPDETEDAVAVRIAAATGRGGWIDAKREEGGARTGR